MLHPGQTAATAPLAGAGSPSYEMTGETGSYRYMAPEVFKHQRYGHKVDIFAYGVIIFQLFEKRVPFEGLAPEAMARMVAEKNLRPACAWLASELLGGSEKVASLQEIDADKLDALRNLVDAYPTVLGLSVEKNLKPKLHALRTELKPSELRDRGKHPLARDGAAAAVLQCPALLGYSLDGRLRPRLRRIRQAGLPLADIATLAQCPEAQFEKRLQGRLARA